MKHCFSHKPSSVQDKFVNGKTIRNFRSFFHVCAVARDLLYYFADFSSCVLQISLGTQFNVFQTCDVELVVLHTINPEEMGGGQGRIFYIFPR